MQRLYSILFLLCSLTGCNKVYKLGMCRAKEQSGSFLGQLLSGSFGWAIKRAGSSGQRYQLVDETEASKSTLFRCLACGFYCEGPNYEIDQCILVHCCSNNDCKKCLIKYRCGCARRCSKGKRYCTKCCGCSKSHSR